MFRSLLLFLFFLSFCTDNFSQVTDSLNIRSLDTWSDTTLSVRSGIRYNDVWGYEDGNNHEYAIIGGIDSFFIFDVTTIPIQKIAAIVGGGPSIWRDFKTYQHYLYAVSENSSEGLVIVDMSNLPNSPSVVYRSTEHFAKTHNIYIDEANAKLYVVGSNVASGGMVVLDLSVNPASPTLLATLLFSDITGDYTTNFYIHDLYVRDNIAYCSHGYAGFFMWDLNDLNNVQLLGSYNPDGSGYNHSNWLSDDGQTIVYAEEIPAGRPLSIIDISDLTLIDPISTYKDPLLSPNSMNNIIHNPYILNDKVYMSNYEDGVVIVDISDLANPYRTAYYDTYYQNTSYGGYHGCWGVYPFLSSGKILASDVSNGLFVLEEDYEIVLPVTWGVLTAQKINASQAMIQWGTYSELDNDFFIVEKSLDGKHFETLHKVFSNNYSAKISTYNSMDNALKLGVNYYRIMQVDKNGNRSYSKIISIINSEKELQISLVNNVVFADKITLKLNGVTGTDIPLQIINNSGKTIWSSRIEKGEFLQSHYPIQIPPLGVAGQYYLIIWEDSKPKKTFPIHYTKE